MEELKKYSLLLSVLALLIFVKFIIVPVVNWQSTILADIELLELKNQKIVSLLNNKEEQIKNDTYLSDILTPYREVFYPVPNESEFKLKEQKEVVNMLDKFELKALNVGWQISSVDYHSNLVSYPLELRVTGNSSDLIKFILAIESKPNALSIENFNINIKGQQEDSLGTASGKILLRFTTKKLQEGKV